MEAELVADVLYGPARTLGGSRLDDDELIKLAREEFEGQPFCVVRNWMILDLLLPEAQESEVRRKGCSLQSCMPIGSYSIAQLASRMAVVSSQAIKKIFMVVFLKAKTSCTFWPVVVQEST